MALGDSLYLTSRFAVKEIINSNSISGENRYLGKGVKSNLYYLCNPPIKYHIHNQLANSAL